MSPRATSDGDENSPDRTPFAGRQGDFSRLFYEPRATSDATKIVPTGCLSPAGQGGACFSVMPHSFSLRRQTKTFHRASVSSPRAVEIAPVQLAWFDAPLGDPPALGVPCQAPANEGLGVQPQNYVALCFSVPGTFS